MQKRSNSRGTSSRWLPGGRRLLALLCTLLLLCTFTIFSLSSNISYPGLLFAAKDVCNGEPALLPSSSSSLLHSQIFGLQAQVGVLLQQLHNDSLTGSKPLSAFSDQLLRLAVSLDKVAGSLSNPSRSSLAATEMSQVDEDLTEPTDDENEYDSTGRVKSFTSGEVHNYISPKPNRQNGKKNFLGMEAITPAVGFGCAHMATHLDRFVSYKMYEMCPDDWDVAQRLILNGCDPLPRRLCFSRASPSYTNPIPLMNSSLWAPPSDSNIMWSHYKCKSYDCLVSGEANRRGFFKCADCFNLTKRGWEVATNESISAEFTIDEVLTLKPSEIRVGLDFSPTTGTFAALMRERGVTIISATLNLGAPFSEVIALRGLLPLYVSVGTRLPFFDDTLDIVHSILFLDGWIRVELLRFVLFDLDRVLRPRGLLWVDRFFCKKEDMKMYLDEFGRLGYRKLLWRVVPKTDKLGDELFFSAVLEKPTRT
ncbi:unnamed protein product [Linum tenue]|uniref:S-adenosyl-L-methionine-dependent methyltransferase superfamily protein n=1 Tax=Linum tenue TaxID=586396 RepID=A0AAV0N7Z8_9ROSI|nr:unnamed protein product [Linum tenue]